MWSDRRRHSDAECNLLLGRLLTDVAQILAILAPDSRPAPSLSNEQEREVVTRLGLALWDIFSDNHTVIDADGTEYDLGSFRGSAGFIAESINQRYPHLDLRYEYMDFYMGTMWSGDQDDLRSLYRWIFARLKDEGCDWNYSFPRLHLVDFSGQRRSDDEYSYDPSEAVRAELAEADEAQPIGDLAAGLESAYERDVRDARRRPLPPTVAAYRDVYLALPDGWPHPDI